MARQEDVVCRRQGEAIEQRLVGRNGFGSFQALAITAAENIGGYHQLIAAHFLVPGDFIGINVNELDHPIRIGAASRGNEIRNRWAADLYWFGQNIGSEGEDVSAAGGLPLVVHQPLWPR